MHLVVSLFGSGVHPAAWRLSDGVPSLDAGHYRRLAAKAESGLLDAVFLRRPLGSERLFATGAVEDLQLDTMPLLGTLAPVATRIGLGASTTLDFTEPFHTARAFSILDRLSAGRTAWLLDRFGPDERVESFGHVPIRTTTEAEQRADEYLDVVFKLWDSWEDDAIVADKAEGLFADSDKIHRINHEGPFFSVRGPLTAVRPVQGRPVIVQADASAIGLRRAAETADIFLVSAGTPGEAATVSRVMKRQAAEGGRSPDDLRILVNVAPVLAATEAEARRRAGELDAWIAPDLARALAADAGSAGGEEAGRRLATSRAGMPFVGTPEQFADLLAGWHASGACDGFNLAPPVLPFDLDAVVDGLVPLLQRRGLFRTGYEGTTLREHLGLARPRNRYAA